MTKFEEEAIKEAKKSKVIAKSYEDRFTASDIGLNIKLGRATHNFPWLEFAKNWHSDEEFQELFDKYSNLNDNYEKEVIRSSKLESQIADLKSQLQQQALPVVPECVAEFIEDCKKEGECLFGIFADATRVEHDMPDLVYFWLGDEGNNDELFARAWLDGYQVEKPQLFEVKMPIVYWDDDASQLTNGFEFLRIDKETDEVDFIGFLSNTKKHTVYFTEQEIKSIDERYWQFAVPVEDEE